jgi:hypothetical protein
LDCMVEVKMRWFKYFVDAVSWSSYQNLYTGSSPIAVLAAFSHCSAPKITTSVGTPVMLPNNPFPNSLVSLVQPQLRSMPFLQFHWTIVQRDSCRLHLLYSNAKAVIFFYLRLQVTTLHRFNWIDEIRIVWLFIIAISARVGGLLSKSWDNQILLQYL